MMHGHTNIKLK